MTRLKKKKSNENKIKTNFNFHKLYKIKQLSPRDQRQREVKS